MKLIIARDNLHRAMQNLQNIAATKNALPILGNVLLNASDDGIELSATDLEVGLRLSVEGTVEETGVLTIPARKLSELVAVLPNEDIVMATSGSNQIQIECGRTETRMFGMPANDFPKIAELGDTYFTMDAELLHEMIHGTKFAVSTEESRYFLNGVYFDMSPKWVRTVATDSRRLAMMNFEAEGLVEKAHGVIIPSKAAEEVVRTFQDKGEVKIAVQHNQIVFADDRATLTSRLMEGEYPAYSQIIPKDNPIRLTADCGAFLTAVRRVSLFSNPKTTSVRLEIKETTMTVYASSPDFGEAKEELEVDCTEPITIGFNAKFLTDALSAIDAESVHIDMKEPLSAAVLRPAGNDDYLCLIMPMRIEG
ncbi:MAG: DNA polymerase III subunit beta [Candidatus Poribacteria bacterium]|nr:DNA polymerase III subunit beta [Candidatus Poribacteria bacterium]